METFVTGPIDTQVITDTILEAGRLKDAGGHSIFLGQIRNDNKETGHVTAIDYTAYEEMAEKLIDKICRESSASFNLKFYRVRHSLGSVRVGELCLFVFTAAAHRKAAIDACTQIVERIKSEVPIWGREILSDESYQWKVNTSSSNQ